MPSVCSNVVIKTKTKPAKKYDFQKTEGTDDLSFCFQSDFLEGPETKQSEIPYGQKLCKKNGEFRRKLWGCTCHIFKVCQTSGSSFIRMLLSRAFH